MIEEAENEDTTEDTEFDLSKIKNELSSEVMEVANLLEADPEFEMELDIILSAMQENSVNLSFVQSHIMLLIEKALKKLTSKKEDIDQAQNIFKEKKELITQHLKELSTYLMLHRSSLIAKTMFGIDNPEDKNLFMTSEIKNHLKRILRRFAIYEVYKIMTPRRIAGQTKRQNFVANAVMRGMKVAMKNEGGSIQDIKSYGKDVLKEINGHRNALRSGEIKILGKDLK